MTSATKIYAPTLRGSATVCEPLIGCWDRRSLRFADGSEDTTSRVIWLQTASGVADMRIAATRPDLRGRGGLEACSIEELLELAEQDCFCGVTLFDADAQPHPTARWPVEREGFRFQPVVTFPEPGWLEWREGGVRMIERAPSGAYEEDWRLRPRSQIFAAHLSRRADRDYVSVPWRAITPYMRAAPFRNRSEEALPELARDSASIPRVCGPCLDCEFSYARRRNWAANS